VREIYPLDFCSQMLASRDVLQTPATGCNFSLTGQRELVSMTGVQLGGIDPSILRELSGVYKPFVKALKE